MSELKLALKITTDGAGKAKAEIEGVAKAENSAGDAAALASTKVSGFDSAVGGAGSSSAMMAGKVASIGTALAGLSFGAIIVGLKETEKELQNVNTRIDFFAGSAKAGAAAQAELHGIARELHADYVALADTYAKLTPLEQAGLLTHQQTIGLLTGMSNAGKALGAENSQLSQSFYGLSQALASPVVHAEELSQIVEPLPGLLQAMDRAAMLPAGGLRQLVNDGKLTSTMLADILVRALREFDGAAAATAGNIADSEQRTRNAWQELASTFEKPINFAMNGMADFLEVQLFQFKAEIKALGDAWDWLFAGRPNRGSQVIPRAPDKPEPVRQIPQGFIGPVIPDTELKARQKTAKDIADAQEAAAKTAAAAQERADHQIARSKIELLKATGETVAALRAEAEEMGLSGQQAIEYIETELKTIRAKDDAKAATERHTQSIHDQAEAQRLLSGILKESSDPWEKFQAKMAEVEAAMGKVNLSNEELTRISQVLNRELEQNRQAWDDSGEAMNAHVKAFEAQKKKTDDVIDSLRNESEQLKRTGTDLEIYNNLKAAGDATPAKKAEIEALTRANAEGRKVRDQNADAAKLWEDAWQQATRRVDDTFRNLWADVFTGSKTVMQSLKTTFMGLLAEMAHAAITRPIMVSILGAMGAPTGTANAGATGGLAGVVGNAFSSAIVGGLSKALGGIFGGSGASAMGMLGTLGGGAAIGAFLPSLLGIRGGGTIADRALPIAGGLGGAVLGSTVVAPIASSAAFSAMGGVAGGAAAAHAAGIAGKLAVPIIGAIVAVTMALMASLIKKAPPKAMADLTLSRANALTVNSTSQSGGGSAAQLVGLGGYFSGATSSIERALGVEVGAYGIRLNRRGRDLTVTGSAGGKDFFGEKIGGAFDKKGKVNEEAVQRAFDAFMAAMLKRSSVVRQVDDELTKGAIRTADTLTQVRGKLKQVAAIRAFEDQSGGLASTLDALNADYAKYQRQVRAMADKASRDGELDKLGQAFAAKFEQQAVTVQQALTTAMGGSTSGSDQIINIIQSFSQIQAQDAALQKAAAKSGGKVGYTPIGVGVLDALQATAIDTAFRKLAGASDSLQDSVQSLALQMGDLRTAAQLAGKSAAEIAALEAKALANFKTSLLEPITSYITGLKTKDESLSPQDRLKASQAAYSQSLLKAQAGDKTALQDLPNAAENFRQAAMAFFGSDSKDYAAIRDGMVTSLERVGDNIGSLVDSQYQNFTTQLQGMWSVQAPVYSDLATAIKTLTKWLDSQSRAASLTTAQPATKKKKAA